MTNSSSSAFVIPPDPILDVKCIAEMRNQAESNFQKAAKALYEDIGAKTGYTSLDLPKKLEEGLSRLRLNQQKQLDIIVQGEIRKRKEEQEREQAKWSFMVPKHLLLDDEYSASVRRQAEVLFQTEAKEIYQTLGGDSVTLDTPRRYEEKLKSLRERLQKELDRIVEKEILVRKATSDLDGNGWVDEKLKQEQQALLENIQRENAAKKASTPTYYAPSRTSPPSMTTPFSGLNSSSASSQTHRPTPARPKPAPLPSQFPSSAAPIPTPIRSATLPNPNHLQQQQHIPTPTRSNSVHVEPPRRHTSSSSNSSTSTLKQPASKPPEIFHANTQYDSSSEDDYEDEDEDNENTPLVGEYNGRSVASKGASFTPLHRASPMPLKSTSSTSSVSSFNSTTSSSASSISSTFSGYGGKAGSSASSTYSAPTPARTSFGATGTKSAPSTPPQTNPPPSYRPYTSSNTSTPTNTNATSNTRPPPPAPPPPIPPPSRTKSPPPVPGTSKTFEFPSPNTQSRKVYDEHTAQERKYQSFSAGMGFGSSSSSASTGRGGGGSVRDEEEKTPWEKINGAGARSRASSANLRAGWAASSASASGRTSPTADFTFGSSGTSPPKSSGWQQKAFPRTSANTGWRSASAGNPSSTFGGVRTNSTSSSTTGGSAGRKEPQYTDDDYARARMEEEAYNARKLARDTESLSSSSGAFERISSAYQRYESRWASLSSLQTISYSDIPWPVLPTSSGTVNLTPLNISAFLLSPHHSGNKSRKDRIKAELLRWHPDRFEGRLLTKVGGEKEKERVRESVGEVARVLSGLLSVGGGGFGD